jgi:hypothetical protein
LAKTTDFGHYLPFDNRINSKPLCQLLYDNIRRRCPNRLGDLAGRGILSDVFHVELNPYKWTESRSAPGRVCLPEEFAHFLAGEDNRAPGHRAEFAALRLQTW